MKKIKYYIIALFLTLSFSSCQDWLTLYPENEQTSHEYWRSKEEVEAVLAAGYTHLRSTDEEMFIWGEARGNGVYSTSTASADVSALTNGMEMSNITPTNAFVKWGDFYKVINMANSVIKYAPGVVDKDQSFNKNVMNSYLSEAYFLRGLCYFYLVRAFRDVPYVTEPYVTDAQPYQLAKTSGDVILNSVLDDLRRALPAAKSFFPELDYNNQVSSKGRGTKWGIYALIADISLWMGNYQDCIDAADSVINSGYVGLIQPGAGDEDTPEFRKEVWFRNFSSLLTGNYTKGNSNESIFEVQYDHQLAQYSNYYTWFVTNNRWSVSLYTLNMMMLNESDDDVRGTGATFTSETNQSIWKYIGKDTKGVSRADGYNRDQNWIVYRLADVILMKAEAYIMMDQFDPAIALINQIRSRAGVSPLSLIGSPTQASMLIALLEERQCEFVAEGKNWFDLLRIGKRDNFRYKYILIDQIKLRDLGSSSVADIVVSRLTDNNALYMPIHSDELKNNKLLTQNPYYERFGN